MVYAKMGHMKASDLFVHCLKNEGVEYVFGVPGEENLDLLKSLESSSVEFISVRHEQAAAFMADAYGRLTGKAGVCLSTLGPGATNLCTGIADAFLDRAPVVAITAQADRSRMHKESHQFIPIHEHFASITKWGATITTTSAIPEIVRKAFKVAEMHKPGPTHIEFPEDIAEKEIADPELKPLQVSEKIPMRVRRTWLRKARELIAAAKNPLIFVGNGVIRDQASESVRAFAELTHIPVINTFMAKGVMTSGHHLQIGTLGLQARDYVQCAVERADLIIAIGYDLVEYSPMNWNPHRDKKILHIDTTPAEIDGFYPVELELVGDLKVLLEAFAKLLKQEKVRGEDHLNIQTAMKKEIEDYKDDLGFPVKPQKILWDIRQILGPEDILVSDVGAHKMWVARVYPAYSPNTVLISNGLAAMGFALPSAIAAKLIFPEKKVCAVVGDSGFMMNIQELETAVRLNTPMVIVIFNDRSHGLIEWKAQIKFKEHFDYGMKNKSPDFVKLAESFGGAGILIKKTDELFPALEKAFKMNTVVVIDVPVDYSENMKLTQKLKNLSCPIT